MIKLYQHQIKILSETDTKNKVAYYLDMGLGKTFVGSEKLNRLNSKVNLIVCQKSKLKDWYEHFTEFYPEYSVYIIKKEIPIIESNEKIILIINYDLVWRRPTLLKLREFTLLLDESSMIKNSSSNRTKFILKLRPKNIILLSGTPVAGKYEELYSQIKLLGWNITKKQFYKHYMITVMMNLGGFKKEKVIGYKNIPRLKRKLREYGAVFLKTDEVFNLPDTEDIEVKVAPPSYYSKFKKDCLITIDGNELVGDTSLSKMLYERQIVSQYNKNKFDALKDLLESTETRIIVFYNFKSECEKIKAICNKLNKPISEVNGSIHDLNNYNNTTNSVTLIQYQAGAMGLNLQLSNIIIYFSLPLQSDLFEQSKKRTHRIGQEKRCLYYYLLTENSIDMKILKALKEKKDFTDKLFNDRS